MREGERREAGERETLWYSVCALHQVFWGLSFSKSPQKAEHFMWLELRENKGSQVWCGSNSAGPALERLGWRADGTLREVITYQGWCVIGAVDIYGIREVPDHIWIMHNVKDNPRLENDFA